MDDNARVKDAYSLESYIPDLKKAGSVYKKCCPFHSEKTPSFVVFPKSQQWRCFGACQTTGDLYSYAMKLNNWTFPEALKELAAQKGIRLNTHSRKENEASARLLGLLKEAADFYHHALLYTDEAIPAMDYLINQRGLSVSDIETWYLGYAPQQKDASYSHLKTLGYTEQEMIAAGVRGRNDETKQTYDRFYHRIMFPIHDDKGHIRGFSARRMPDAKETDAKYINSPQSELFSKSSLLYGLFRAKNGLHGAQMPFQGLAVVEGNMDVVRAHKMGFTNVVAQMGTSLTDKHFEMLTAHTKTVVLCMDNDAAGQGAMHKRARQIITDGHAARRGIDVKIASLGTFKDPDEMIKADSALWKKAIDRARPIVDVLVGAETSTLPPNATPQQKTEKAREMFDILRVPNNPLVTQDNTRKLAVALGLPESLFVQWATPQLIILQGTSRSVSIASSIGPVTEAAILRAIVKNAPDYWLARANAALDCLTKTPMPYALAALSVLDFTCDIYRHLFEAFIQSDGYIKPHVEGTPLENIYERVVNKPLIVGRFEADTPEAESEDTYEEFLSSVFDLRIARLESDMEMFDLMGDNDSFMEAMKGIKIIQKASR